MAEEQQKNSKEGRRLGQKLSELREQIEATEGYRIRLKIQALGRTYHVSEGNYRDLIEALDAFGSPEVFMEIWREDRREQLDAFMNEVTRLLHNFLAGAKTLVDHTRVFKNEMYKGRSFDKTYQEKMGSDLSSSPVVNFVQDLRNYVLHKQLPISSAEFSFSGGEGGHMTNVDSTIKLDVNKLREWDGWTRKSPVYLDALDDQVKIKEVAEQYEAPSGTSINGSGSNRQSCTASNSVN